jgi:2-polyprenyl-3-methyl-5-hydroxy-6-metoxy-1,4-benzoquinol methylase
MRKHREYEEKSESWWNYTHNFFYRKFYVAQEQIIKKALNVLKPSVVLDAGCGYGRYTKILKDMNIDVHSIDKSESMIREAKRINPRAKVCAVENIDYPRDFFDLVLCIDVSDHLESFEMAVREFYKVLKKSGFLLLTVAIPYSPLILMNRAIKPTLGRLMKRPPISRGYSKNEMQKILKDFAFFTLTLYHHFIPMERLYICGRDAVLT